MSAEEAALTPEEESAFERIQVWFPDASFSGPLEPHRRHPGSWAPCRGGEFVDAPREADEVLDDKVSSWRAVEPPRPSAWERRLTNHQS